MSELELREKKTYRVACHKTKQLVYRVAQKKRSQLCAVIFKKSF